MKIRCKPPIPVAGPGVVGLSRAEALKRLLEQGNPLCKKKDRRVKKEKEQDE